MEVPVLRSDNGLIYQSRRFRHACRDYRLQQEFITPYTPEQDGIIERFFRSPKGSACDSTSSRRSRRLGRSFGTGATDTTRAGHRAPSAIEVLSNTGHNNQLKWPDLWGALHHEN